MAFWISAIALLLVLIFFFGRREAGPSFRERYRAKRPVQRRDEPINPDFQFEQPPADADNPKSDDPKQDLFSLQEIPCVPSLPSCLR